jgi:hypothetical protein
MMSQLKRAWKRDRLGGLAVCCAIIAAALVVLPDDVRWERTFDVIDYFTNETRQMTESGYRSVWFGAGRLPAAGVFAFAAVTMLLLRRR